MRIVTAVVFLACTHRAPPPSVAPDIDRELDAIAALCKDHPAPDCQAPKNVLCDAMFRSAHACFESANGRDCKVLHADVANGLAAREMSASTQEHTGNLCEQACLVRQQGKPWDDLAQALETTDCGSQ